MIIKTFIIFVASVLLFNSVIAVTHSHLNIKEIDNRYLNDSNNLEQSSMIEDINCHQCHNSFVMPSFIFISNDTFVLQSIFKISNKSYLPQTKFSLFRPPKA